MTNKISKTTISALVDNDYSFIGQTDKISEVRRIVFEAWTKGYTNLQLRTEHIVIASKLPKIIPNRSQFRYGDIKLNGNWYEFVK